MRQQSGCTSIWGKVCQQSSRAGGLAEKRSFSSLFDAARPVCAGYIVLSWRRFRQPSSRSGRAPLAELLELCRPRRWEVVLGNSCFGCITVLILTAAGVGVLSVLLGRLFPDLPPGLLGYPLIFVVFPMVFLLWFLLPRIRRASCLRDLARRLHLDPEHELGVARAEMAESPSPDLILLFSGQGLPYGKVHFLKIVVTGRHAYYSGVSAPPLWRLVEQENPEEQIVFREERLAPAVRRELVELAEAAASARPFRVYGSLHAAFPCHLTIFLANPRREVAADWDGGAFPTGLSDHPAAHLFLFFNSRLYAEPPERERHG